MLAEFHPRPRPVSVLKSHGRYQNNRKNHQEREKIPNRYALHKIPPFTQTSDEYSIPSLKKGSFIIQYENNYLKRLD